MTKPDEHHQQLKDLIMFAAGLVGMFAYLALSTITGRFEIEWLLAFLAMMGIPGAKVITRR